MSRTVLLVDDEPNVLAGLTRVLRKEPYEILTAPTAEDAAHILENVRVDLIVCDEEMPGMSGTEFLRRVAEERPEITRIVLTGHPTLPTALRAMNEGKVYHFFTKPCNEIDLAITIRHALEQKDLTEKARALLQVTKRQSVLIDEARILRRLRDVPHKTRAEAAAKREDPVDRQELLDEMDLAIQEARTILATSRNPEAIETQT
jgi:two-component system probable response regulator PhcQ